MLDYIKEVHANTLDKLGVVTFYDDDGFFYEIFEFDNGGYMVEVYDTDDDDVEVRTLTYVNGGLCTGSAFDAIGFMLEGDL